MTSAETDWHQREHDQVTERLGKIQETLEDMTVTLAEMKAERQVRAIASSYVIPGAVAVAVAYVSRKLNL